MGKFCISASGNITLSQKGFERQIYLPLIIREMCIRTIGGCLILGGPDLFVFPNAIVCGVVSHDSATNTLQFESVQDLELHDQDGHGHATVIYRLPRPTRKPNFAPSTVESVLALPPSSLPTTVHLEGKLLLNRTRQCIQSLYDGEQPPQIDIEQEYMFWAVKGKVPSRCLNESGIYEISVRITSKYGIRAEGKHVLYDLQSIIMELSDHEREMTGAMIGYEANRLKPNIVK